MENHIFTRCTSRVPSQSTLICLTSVSLLVLVLFITGCLPVMVAHSVRRDSETGGVGTYSEMKGSMKSLPSEAGRLVVYVVTTSGVGDLLISGIGCTVDKQVYKILDKAFWYVDLPIGTHKLTVDGVLLSNPTYGKSVLEFDLKEGEAKYCRIDVRREWKGSVFGGSWVYVYTAIFLQPSVAEHEMANHDYYKNYKTDLTVK